MTQRDHERLNTGWHQENNELDGALDAALAKYAAVQPRAGLEDRVLANLPAERAQVPVRAWWRWGVTGALATVAVVALALVWRSGKPMRPVVANHSPAARQASKKPEALVVSSGGANQRPPYASTSAKKQAANQVRHETVAASLPKFDQPKLDRFPSAQPLSEQEKILQNYVAEYPEKAVLIARARSEELQRDLEEMKALASGQQRVDLGEQSDDATER